jgi:phosphatidate cytidylyltransferase
MAINIQKLGTRALTALIFVTVLLGGMLFSYLSFSILFLIVAMWGLQEYFKVGEALGLSPSKTLGFAAGIFVYGCFLPVEIVLGLPSPDLRDELLVVIPFVILSGAVFSKKPLAFSSAVFTLGGLSYTVLPFGLLHFLVVSPGEGTSVGFDPSILLGVILLIWCNDTFAYLGGSLYGKHKMIERISPGKTWEGTLTGIALSFAGSFLLRASMPPGHENFWPVAGIMVPVLATIGDLVQSSMKRQAGLKDTGHIMPGHGGILDRFDSLIFVTPFALLLLRIIS